MVGIAEARAAVGDLPEFLSSTPLARAAIPLHATAAVHQLIRGKPGGGSPASGSAAGAVAGVEPVGIGSDFDGGGTVLRDATAFPLLTEGLLRRGFTPEEVRKILGENALRVLGGAIGG